MRGYFGIGILSHKHDINIGTLFRSAYCFGADFVFTIGKVYKRDSSDTPDATKHIPCFYYPTLDDFIKGMPKGCDLVCVENSKNAFKIKNYVHPKRACYLLGNETTGLPSELTESHQSIIIDTKRCLNVGIAGSIVMFDRLNIS